MNYFAKDTTDHSSVCRYPRVQPSQRPAAVFLRMEPNHGQHKSEWNTDNAKASNDLYHIVQCATDVWKTYNISCCKIGFIENKFL